ncbi:phytanoyl-CoA dioxygenase family protein [Pseudomonadales bacterium]|nr:phytanoyl-CoA dioxygenase family protein [Pseudomonadales bacterium]
MPENSDLPITYQHVPRFQPGSRESIDYLDEHGYVVIASALTNDEAATAVSKLWDYLEALGTGINRNDPNTWDNERWPTAVHGGILPGHGIGQCDAQWYIRDVPNVRQSFAAVWDTEELLVSFDGVSLWRPWSFNPEWKTGLGGSWLHIDQHPLGRPGKQCVQGLVNLLPTTPNTGGNVVIPGSHMMHDQISELYTERLARIPAQIDHFRFPNNDPLLADSNPITCHMEAGDLLLWDSRTIHCSSPPTNTDAVAPDKNALIRAISLICMMPRSKSNEDVILRRKAAVSKLTSTTNWSDVWVNADKFPEVSAPGVKEKYTLPPVPELNAAQLKMVGWTDEELAAR